MVNAAYNFCEDTGIILFIRYSDFFIGKFVFGIVNAYFHKNL